MLQDVISLCSILLKTDDTETITALYEVAISEFKDYCNREDVPTTITSLIANMICVQYNRLGAQGLSSQGFSGVSESFIDGYPDNIRKQLNRYRKVKTI